MSPQRRFRKHGRSQRGQALVYLAVILVVLVGVLYATFDLARLTTAKIQSQNAADAAALAAASIKVSVHNTRTLAYAAMTAEATMARLELAKAVAILGEQPPVPGQSLLALPEFNQAITQANAHLKKLHELRDGLIAYNRWIGQEGPAIVADAARIAYEANIAGMNGTSGGGAIADTANLHLMDGSANLIENGANFFQGEFIGGVNYRSESAGTDGDSGKTFVEVQPSFVPLGSGLLGGGGPMPLTALAAAGPVPSADIAKADPTAGDLSIAGVGLPWYEPRLFPIGEDHAFPHAILH